MVKDNYSIKCRVCGKETIGYKNCQKEYNFDIDGWDGHIEFEDHKKEYCKKENDIDVMEDY